MGGESVDTSSLQEQLRMQREMLDMQKAIVARDEKRLAEQRLAEDAQLRARRKGGGRGALLNNEMGILDPPAPASPVAVPMVA